jgi:hypothetical protein
MDDNTDHDNCMSILTPTDVMYRGLQYCGLEYGQQKAVTLRRKVEQFKAHYGSSPLVVANIWSDLCSTDIEEARFNEVDKRVKGFKKFMMGMFFLWTYPKNMVLMTSRFKVALRSLQGAELWYWLKKIQALKGLKIGWASGSESNDEIIIGLSVDGVDFRCWEKKHPRYNQDTKMCSVKFKKAAFKYEITLDVHQAKIRNLNGGHIGGTHDLVMFRDPETGELKEHLLENPGRMVIADRGYSTGKPDEIGMFALPNCADSKELAHFKSRARCRHETLNGRLKNFKCLQDTFRHGMDNHKTCFEAVCVIVQYQMDNGYPFSNI